MGIIEFLEWVGLFSLACIVVLFVIAFIYMIAKIRNADKSIRDIEEKYGMDFDPKKSFLRGREDEK